MSFDYLKMIRIGCSWFCIILGCTLGSSHAADVTMLSLSEKFQDLEELVIQQHMLLTRQGTKLNDLQATVESQRTEIEEQASTIKELLTWKQEQSTNAKDEAQTDKPVPHALKNVSKPSIIPFSTTTLNETSRTYRFVASLEGPIAFHAVILGGEVPHLGLNQKIVFDVVRLNLGGGYHDAHGLFIAPAPGIYIFSTSIVSYSKNDGDVFMAIMKNGKNLASAYAWGTSAHPYDQGSVTVVVQLALGDEVWVEDWYRSDRSIWGDSDTSFMGCLVVPL